MNTATPTEDYLKVRPAQQKYLNACIYASDYTARQLQKNYRELRKFYNLPTNTDE